MEDQISFSSIGNYRIISYSQPFSCVKQFRGWIIETSGENPPYSFLDLEFRWSINGSNWSLWTNLTEENIQGISLDISNKFYVEFRITAISDENASPYFPPGTPLSPEILIERFEVDLLFDCNGVLGTGLSGSLPSRPSPICSRELTNFPVVFSDCNFTFNPYDVNRGINLYQDMSKLVNNVFGHEVVYYSVQPQGRGKDVVLKEYTLFDVVDDKCIKIMVPNNAFPDSKINFDSFGLQFETPFEIHIDRKYFESIFGKGSQPRKRDIIYFPLTNRIYRIESTYLFRDFNNYPVYFKCQLVKYEIQKNTSWVDPDAESALHDYTVNTNDLFGKEVEDQQEKLTKSQQYVTTSQRRFEDPTRSYISKLLPIIEYDLNNNWTIVFNSYYDLNRLFVDDPNTVTPTSPPQVLKDEEKDAVRWKSPVILEEDGERSFTCWFRIQNYVDKSKLVFRPAPKIPINIESIGTDSITYSTAPIPHELSIGPNPDGFVSILGDSIRSGGFEIIEILNQYTFRVRDSGAPHPGSTSSWKMQKAQLRNFINGFYDGKGIRIDMIWSGTNEVGKTNYIETGSFRIRINDLEIYSPFGKKRISTIGEFIPSAEDWYGLVFNFSNIFKQYSLNIWSMTYDPGNPAAQTSDLSLVHNLVGSLNKKYVYNIPEDIEKDFDSDFYGTNNNSYKVTSSPLFLTNIRLFKNMIEEEKQSTILNQNIVGDSQLSIIIDNAKPILRLPKIARNR